MQNKIKGIFYSLTLGVILGVVGVYLMGYVAAISIPEEWILWFEDNDLAIRVINFVSQFLAFGIIAIIIGIVLGRLSKKWMLNSTLCYLAFLFYVSVGVSIIYQTEIQNPYVGFGYQDIPVIILIPTFLFVSAWLTAKKL